MDPFDPKRFVAMLYRQILGREPDLNGFRASVQFLDRTSHFGKR